MQNLHTKKHQKGIAAAIILLFAAVLAMISLKIIEIGKIGIDVNKEKQALDSCSVLTGNLIVKTNDIDQFCNNEILTQCIQDITNTQTTGECHDLGIECIDNSCIRTIEVVSTYNTGVSIEARSTNILINEEDYRLERVNAAAIFLLDYSGSMRGERIQQLKNTVSLFINEGYNLSYSVILYNNDIIETSTIGIGQQHKQTVDLIVTRNSATGGTNFVKPINVALDQIQNSNYDAYYIILISDGSPNEGAGQSRDIVQRNIFNINEDFCILTTPAEPCITLYSIGVDNANTQVLQNMSGNAINQQDQNYSYTVDANQTMHAFNSIIEEIVCRLGPVDYSESLYVFNGNNMLEENIDFVYDDQSKMLKFYDVDPFYVCTEILQDNNNIVIHWGNPVLKVID